MNEADRRCREEFCSLSSVQSCRKESISQTISLELLSSVVRRSSISIARLRLIATNRNPLSECTIDRIEGANEISQVDAATRQTFDRSRRRTSPLYVDFAASPTPTDPFDRSKPRISSSESIYRSSDPASKRLGQHHPPRRSLRRAERAGETAGLARK